MEQPLAGLKVLDATTFIAGPFATLMLGDLGAHVTKIEAIPDGDPFNRMGGLEHGANVTYVNCNRGKELAFLDLKERVDQAEFRRLVTEADVLVTNWRSSTAASFGLTDDAVRALNPRLVWVKISGYGQSGPLADQPAFDPVIQARSGVAFVQGTQDDPQILNFFFADKTASMFVMSSALAALVRRDRTGEGAIIDLPMLDALAYFNFPDVYANLTMLDVEPTPRLARRGSQIVRTADGWLLVVPVGGRQIAGTLAAIGHPEWKEQLLAAGHELAPLLYDMLRQVLPSGTNEEWLHAFALHEVPAAPVVDPADTIDDPQMLHNGTFGETVHPDLGRIRTARFPFNEAG